MKRPKLRLSTSLVQDNIPAQIPECPRVYIGSIHAAFNAEKLRELGITHIVNASGIPATFPRTFNYLTIELRDKNHANILGCIPAANIFIEAGLDQGGSVLVHCAGGRSRSAAFITAFLMSTQGLSLDRALRTVKAARAVVSVNLGFQLQLEAYAASKCDVHLAHQLILHKRLERFAERMGRMPRFQTLYSPDAAQEKEATAPPSLHEEAREAALKILDYHPPSNNRNHVRLRLSRPGSSSVQVIPPLRSLERAICCRSCGLHLFTYANVIRQDLDASALDIQAWAYTVMANRSRDMEVEGDSQGPPPLFPTVSPPSSTRSSERRPFPIGSPRHHGAKLFKSQSQPSDLNSLAHSPRLQSVGDPPEGPRAAKYAALDPLASPRMPHSQSVPDLEDPFNMDDIDAPTVLFAAAAADAHEVHSARGEGRRRRDSNDGGSGSAGRLSPLSSIPPSSMSSAFSLTDASSLPTHQLPCSSLPVLACTNSPNQPRHRTQSLDGPSSLPPIQDSWRMSPHNQADPSVMASSPLSDVGFFTPPSTSRSPPTTPLESSPPSETFMTHGGFRHQRSYSMEKRMWLDRLRVLEAVNDREDGQGIPIKADAKAAPALVSDRVAKVAADDEAAQRALYSQTMAPRFFESPPPLDMDEGKGEGDEMQVESPSKSASMTKAGAAEEGRGGRGSGHATTASPPLALHEKAFYLEHMPWMGDVTHDLNGSLNCPKCETQVGRFAWEVNHGQLKRPLLAVVRKQVAALPLPSERASRESTPRTTPTSTPGAAAAPAVPSFSAAFSPAVVDVAAAPVGGAALERGASGPRSPHYPRDGWRESSKQARPLDPVKLLATSPLGCPPSLLSSAGGFANPPAASSRSSSGGGGEKGPVFRF